MSDLFKATAVWGTPGGKRLLAKRLAMMLPAHRTYTEAFAGAGSIFFAKEPSDVEILNDIDPDVAAAYRDIKSLTKDELGRLAAKSWVSSRSTWEAICGNSPSGRVDRLYKFLYITRFSYSKERASFDPGNDGVVAKTIIAKVVKAHDRLAKTKIMVGDYSKVIEAHDGPDALHVFDPPYPGHESTDYGPKSSFDEDEFYKRLKGIRGRFMAITGVRGRLDWGPFNVRKVSHYRSIGRARGGDAGNNQLENLVITNFEIKKSLGNGWWLLDMKKAFPGGRPEAGIHLHALRREDSTTAKDGAHRHAFRIGDDVVWTDEGGAHEHTIEQGMSAYASSGGAHAHRLVIPGGGAEGADLETFTSPDGSWHTHQMQSTHTAFDGAHGHSIQLGTEVIESLSGADVWAMRGKPDQAQNPPAPPASALAALAMGDGGPSRGMDAFVAGSVCVGEDGCVYVDSHDMGAAVTAAMAKRLPDDAAANARVISAPPPMAHVRVAEIVVRPSRERTMADAGRGTGRVDESGDAFHAVDDAGLGIGVFKSRSFAESVLKEVGGMRGEDGLPSVLSWSSVESGAMPPPGMSMLPPSLERQIPDHLRFWKMVGEPARNARDALVDSGFAAAIMDVDGERRAVRTSVSICKAQDLEGIPPVPGSMEDTIAEMAGRGCGVWESEALPDQDIGDGPVFVPPGIAQRWAEAGRLPGAIEAFAKHSSGALIACFDSVLARTSMSMAGNALQVRRSACANLVFHATDPELAKAMFVHALADIPMGIAFESETEFKLGKSANGDRYLVIGSNAFLLSKPLDDSGSFAALVDEPECLDILDSGAAIEKDDGAFRMFRLRGSTLFGEFSARPTGSMWRITKDSGPQEDIRVRSLHKARKNEGDEQFILGVVMEPEEVDAHKDIVSAAEIRQAAHDYMIKSRRIKLQHQKVTEKVAVVQSFTAPHRLNIGGQRVKADSWLMGMLVLDAGLWKRFMAGEYTGLSIGGSGFRDPSV